MRARAIRPTRRQARLVRRMHAPINQLPLPTNSPKGGENMANKAPSRPPKQEKKYEENPDYGTLFQREGNEHPQPGFSGEGVLSQETIDGILAAGGKFQIALWTRGEKGRMRNRDGTYRFRFHIEPPWEGDAGETDDDEPDDDLPF